jgi:hypothetical protein
MPDPRSTTRPADDSPGLVPGPAYAIARELLGVLPFGARADTLARCPRLVEQVEAGDPVADDDGRGDRTTAVLVDAIESFSDAVLLDRQPEPLPPALVRRMLHVLLATRDLGWPGTDAPLSVRRVAAADLYFDATQEVLTDHDWKGPHGVEFALLTALAAGICRTAALRASADADRGRAWDAGEERLGHLHRVQRPRGL